jgi:hypothetical protein
MDISHLLFEQEKGVHSLISISEKFSEYFNIIIYIAIALPKRNPGSMNPGFLLKGLK